MDVKKLKDQLQTEVDTAFLYESIANIQNDDNLIRVLNEESMDYFPTLELMCHNGLRINQGI